MEIRGILHCHSDYSYDAKLSLEELRALCIENGVQFVCMTEHTDELTREKAEAFVRDCDRLSDETFRFIPGFEVPYKDAHILMIGAREFFGVYAPTIASLREWVVQEPFVVLAHPVRNHFRLDDGLLETIDALEVWNQQYEGKRVPRTRSLALFKTLHDKKPSLIATGGVDLHRREHMGSPLVTLSVDSLTEASIIEKLRQGAFLVSGTHAQFYGTLPDAGEKIRAYRFQSFISVSIIMAGKWVNKVLAGLGLSLPKSLKQRIRKHL